MKRTDNRELRMFPRARLSQLAWLLPFVVASAACEPTEPVASGETLRPTEPSVEDSPYTLSLFEARTAGLAVDIVFRQPETAPRMMELRVEVGSGLRLARAEPLSAITAAGKELVVQPDGDFLRIVVFASSNVLTLASGPLARLHFDAVGDGPRTVRFVERMPVFAPQEANMGLRLGDSLTLGGGR